MSEAQEARESLAAAARRLAEQGLVLGTAGNLSVRMEDRVAVTASGVVLAEATPASIVVCDLDGEVVEGGRAPSSEIDLHLGIYRRFGAGAVVHTHAPVATALSCVLEEVPCVHYGMLGLGGSVRVAPYRTFGTPELAAVTLDALEGRAAALMANHGAVTHGPDLQAAVDTTLLLEWACTVYWQAAQLGRPRTLDDDDLAAVVEAAVARNYSSQQRLERAG